MHLNVEVGEDLLCFKVGTWWSVGELQQKILSCIASTWKWGWLPPGAATIRLESVNASWPYLVFVWHIGCVFKKICNMHVTQSQPNTMNGVYDRQNCCIL